MFFRREMSLAHVGLKEMKEIGPSLPTKSCSDSLGRAELSQSAKNGLSGRGEGKRPSVPCASDACKKAPLTCPPPPPILPHGVVSPTVPNPGQLEKAAHVCTTKSFEIIPEPSTQNTLGFTIWRRRRTFPRGC